MTVVAIHQPQYLPWLPYCAKAASCDIFVYLDNVQYQKNGVQNRNQIKAANGPVWLTVPVRASLDTTIQSTPICNNIPWQKKHLNTIEMAYARAAHKHILGEGLRELIESDWTYLADLNIAITEWIFARLGIECKRIRASELAADGAKDDLVLGICKSVGATTYLSGQGARAYQDPAKFENQGVELSYHVFEEQVYQQCHMAQGFVNHMSALDLLMNVGDSAGDVMRSGNGVNHV